MRPALAVTTALLLLLGTGVVEAASSAWLAETAGFLLGNAHRCGIPTDRVQHAGKVIHHLIVAASSDPTEEAAANSRFAETFLATAFPGQDSDVQGGDRPIRTARAPSSASRHELTNLQIYRAALSDTTEHDGSSSFTTGALKMTC
jgi:hypothetical protein